MSSFTDSLFSLSELGMFVASTSSARLGARLNVCRSFANGLFGWLSSSDRAASSFGLDSKPCASGAFAVEAFSKMVVFCPSPPLLAFLSAQMLLLSPFWRLVPQLWVRPERYMSDSMPWQDPRSNSENATAIEHEPQLHAWTTVDSLQMKNRA
jgi:hypothetical protein